MTVEDLIDFDKNNLTDYKLIYSKNGKTWYLLYITAILLGIITLIIASYMILSFTNPNYMLLPLCTSLIFILIVLVMIDRKITITIVDGYNKKYKLHLKTNGDIIRDRRIISTIQYLVFADYLCSNNIKLTKKEVTTIIEALKYESSNAEYKYQTLKIIIAFLSILTAALLGSWLQIRSSIDDLIKIALKCFSIFIVMSICIFMVEQFLVKDVIRSRRNKYQRLIRVLENYSINSKF